MSSTSQHTILSLQGLPFEALTDLDAVCNHILDLLELLELVFALDVVSVGNDHSGHQTTERGDTVSLSDAND